MAQVLVDSGVMRDKAKTLLDASNKINILFRDMNNEVSATAGKMKGTTIETQKQKFSSMQPTFETIAADIKSYSDFLNQAAEAYDAAENEGTAKAQEQGRVF